MRSMVSSRQQSIAHRSCVQVVLLGSKMGSIGDGRTGGGLVRSRCALSVLHHVACILAYCFFRCQNALARH